MCFYLFKPNIGEQAGGDSFVSEEFSNWKKKQRFNIHVGGPFSAHNQTWRKCEVLLNQKQHIETIISKQSNQVRSEYRIHLNAFVDCVRFLLRQGIAFRGHDEFENSSNQGNFLELLRFLADHNQDIKAVTLKNVPEILKLIAPGIQKYMVRAIAIETLTVIVKNLGNAIFPILVDESLDLSRKDMWMKKGM